MKERFSYQNLRVYEDMIRAISLGEDIANQATTKAAARLEICAIRGGVTLDEADKLLRLLVQIDNMTAKLACVWKKKN